MPYCPCLVWADRYLSLSRELDERFEVDLGEIGGKERPK
jgi:hypothetical protein